MNTAKRQLLILTLVSIVVVLLSGCASTGGYSGYPPMGYGYGYMPPPPVGYAMPSPNQPVVQPAPIGAFNVNNYDPNSLANPYGAGSQYKPDGLMNPYSENGSRYSNKSWNNPYATDAPKLYDSQGNYQGKLSTNPYDQDSTSNPYGQYGTQNPFSPNNPNNPFGNNNPFAQPVYVVPSK